MSMIKKKTTNKVAKKTTKNVAKKITKKAAKKTKKKAAKKTKKKVEKKTKKKVEKKTTKKVAKKTTRRVKAINRDEHDTWGFEKVLKKLLLEIDNLDTTAAFTINMCTTARKNMINKRNTYVKKFNALLRSKGHHLDIFNLHKKINKIDDKLSASMSSTVEEALFVKLFSLLDNFLSEFLKKSFLAKPEVLKSLSRTLSIKEILMFNTVSDVIDLVIRIEIDDFRRESYDEQFSIMERLFDIKLKEFDRWSAFIESTQRRNLYVHCDGAVSDQYLSICKKNHVQLSDDIKLGSKITIGQNYFLESSSTIKEIGIKLVYTIWRKLDPCGILNADNSLISTVFDLLLTKDYSLAEKIGIYAMSQKKKSCAVNDYMFVINYCIALKNLGKIKEINDKLSEVDWDVVLIDFKIAKALLLDQFDTAVSLIKKMGKEGEYIEQYSYSTWPLFTDLILKDEFLIVYEDIYGTKFRQFSEQ